MGTGGTLFHIRILFGSYLISTWFLGPCALLKYRASEGLRADIIGRVVGEKSLPVGERNQVWNRNEAVSHKTLIFKVGIKFSSPADSCHIVAWRKCVDQYGSPPTTHNRYYDDNSEAFNSFPCHRCLQESIPQRSRFLTRNRFRGIDT
jgi:hypothetical protein